MIYLTEPINKHTKYQSRQKRNRTYIQTKPNKPAKDSSGAKKQTDRTLKLTE